MWYNVYEGGMKMNFNFFKFNISEILIGNFI